jgi:putative redox protein
MGSKIVHIDAIDPSGGNRVRFVAQNPRGDRVTIEAHHDAPKDNDPSSIGLGPMETLLAALGSCTAVDVQDIMTKRRTPLARYRIELEGERADGIPARYTRIVMRHVGSGEGVTKEQFEKAAKLSFEKYCSVSSSLREDIEFVVEARVE